MNTFRLKRNLDEAVYEQILSSIFEGKFHSGEQVQIERLCEQYDISRTPVIQALKRLATDGIVETSPTGKFFFPAADERRVRDMMEMRLFFEVGAALVSSITTHVRYVEEQIIRNIRENEQST